MGNTYPLIKKKCRYFQIAVAMLLVFSLVCVAGCDAKPATPTTPSTEPPVTTEPTTVTEPTIATEPAVTTAPTETTEPPVTTDPTEATEETQPTQPDADAVVASLESLRQAMIETPQLFAAAYFGCTDSTEPVDPFAFMASQAPQLCEDLPFLLAVPEERIIGDRFGELYCIVPRDPEASVSVNGVSKDADGKSVYENVLFRSENGEPILLFCNNSTIEPDTLVNIVDNDGYAVWHPQLDDAPCVAQPKNADGEDVMRDITPYAEFLARDYRAKVDAGWRLPDVQQLAGTSWEWEGELKNGGYAEYRVTFHEQTVDIRWNEGTDAAPHTYSDVPWKLSTDEGFAILTVHVQGFDEERQYDLLLNEESGLLYVMADASTGNIEPGQKILYRCLTQVKQTAPDPMDMVGTWERMWTEVEGYREETAPGICTVVISGENEGDLVISYRDDSFPEYNYDQKALLCKDEEMFPGCGNDQWLAEIDHVDAVGTTFVITLLEDGTLLMQSRWTMDGIPMVSYSCFCRAN